jgi:hypothetical protein
MRYLDQTFFILAFIFCIIFVITVLALIMQAIFQILLPINFIVSLKECYGILGVVYLIARCKTEYQKRKSE